MNLLTIIIGCALINTLAFALGLTHRPLGTIISSVIGIALGHAVAWLITKLAYKEMRNTSFAFLTLPKNDRIRFVELIHKDGKDYLQIYTKSKSGEPVEDILSTEEVTIGVCKDEREAFVCKRELRVKNKLLRLLALTRSEFVDYHITAPYSHLP
jgi:hypothetical protein